MPIFAPLLKPPEELDDDGEAVAVAVGVGVELEAVCGRLVEVEVLVGRGKEPAESVDDIDDDDDDDEVAGARFVCPEARSTAENGNGWRLLVSPELQQSPLPPAQHQLLSLQRLTVVKPLKIPTKTPVSAYDDIGV